MRFDGVPRPTTKFYRVKCQGCGNEQTIFSAASTKVKCLACNMGLAKTTSSKIDLNAKIIKEFE